MRIAVCQSSPKLISRKNIATILRTAARETGTDRPKLEVVVSFVDDSTIRALNKQYRKIDRVTDILSFAYSSLPIKPMSAESNGLPFGELAIATEQVLRQAKRLRHAPTDELRDLLIHGYLHLIGHDHHKSGERRLMRSWEKKIRQQLS